VSTLDWFSNAKVVDKKATAVIARASIKEPVSGNVAIVGDAGASAEAWVQGALASGYQAVKAIKKEMTGKPGYRDYISWWQQAFAFNYSAYQKLLSRVYPLNRVCNDDDIDYLPQTKNIIRVPMSGRLKLISSDEVTVAKGPLNHISEALPEVVPR
jgi:flavin-dependent dehydrogenase